MALPVARPRTKSTSRPTYAALRSYGILAVLYGFLILVLPASNAVLKEYHFDVFQYRVLMFAISVPTMAVWLTAFYSYSRLRVYANSLKRTDEGVNFDKMATGCAWLAWSLPIANITSLILNSIAYTHPGFHNASVILANYISLVLPLVAFSMISQSSKGCTGSTKGMNKANAQGIVLAFVIAGVLYCLFTFQHLNLTSLSSSENPYFLPAWLMVVSLIIPYLYAWFIGLLAAYDVARYNRHVGGLLYKQPLKLVSSGLLTVILSSVALQCLNTIEPRTGRLILDNKLVLTIVFRIVGGIGYLLIAVGANRLKKIEDI